MKYEYRQFRRRKLPHIHPPGSTLFLTLRLADSIPKVVVQQWKAEKDWLKGEVIRISRKANDDQRVENLNQQERLLSFHRKWFAYQAKHGPTWLRNDAIAQIIVDSLKHRDGKVFNLCSYCVMSNHLHTVFRPLLDERSLREALIDGRPTYFSSDAPLDVIMHSFKSYTANQANKLLRRSGAFWETESYDHVIRNEAEFNRIQNYVVKNPVKAGLVDDWRDWPWSWKRESKK
ncbi:MAG TPA: hypothetical protein VN643_06695 [Pyrinomonadaceae bacterium]|nr:hypothetical protein [Pyrinomonadaceae bacterium]